MTRRHLRDASSAQNNFKNGEVSQPTPQEKALITTNEKLISLFERLAVNEGVIPEDKNSEQTEKTQDTKQILHEMPQSLLEANEKLVSLVERLTERDEKRAERALELVDRHNELLNATALNDSFRPTERLMLKRLRDIARERQGGNFDQRKFAAGIDKLGLEFRGSVQADAFMYRYGKETDESKFVDEYGVRLAEVQELLLHKCMNILQILGDISTLKWYSVCPDEIQNGVIEYVRALKAETRLRSEPDEGSPLGKMFQELDERIGKLPFWGEGDPGTA